MRRLLSTGRRKDFVSAVRLALQQVLAGMNVEEHYEQALTLLKREGLYRNLINTWEDLKSTERKTKWQELMGILPRVIYDTRPYCLRCGECCRQGSPSLHQEDLDLISRSLLSTREIYTLRKGEPVKFNVEGRFGILPGELIKIKEDPATGHCIFYQNQEHRCSIYEHRPLQCRIQACWNPQAMEKLWQQEKLTRVEVLGDHEAVLDLLQAHDTRCAPQRLDAAFKRLHETREEEALEQVLEMLRQDLAIRTLCKEKLEFEEEELEFLLGRSLARIVRVYGVRVEESDDGSMHLFPDR
jgi:Fe-S-cluster containining protein